jgi:small nuclear ribonucleoprotein (snRNP)-like protein
MADDPISQPAPGSLLVDLIGQRVVIDLRSTYVALGTLIGADELFVALKNADLHDLRDTDTTRENYIAESKATGIKRNRKRVLVLRSDMVAVARLEDFVDE